MMYEEKREEEEGEIISVIRMYTCPHLMHGMPCSSRRVSGGNTHSQPCLSCTGTGEFRTHRAPGCCMHSMTGNSLTWCMACSAAA